MVKISKALMFKRVLVFLIGLFLAALGVAVSVRSYHHLIAILRNC